MSSVLKQNRLTHEEYFALEQAEDQRYEYHAGEVFAMAGGTESHALIGSNILVGLSNALRGKPHAEAYRRACDASGVAVEEVLFVDDMPKYVRGFLDLGGNGLLIDEAGRFADEGLPRIRSLAELPAYVAAL